MFKNKSPFSQGHGHTQANTNNHSRSPVNHGAAEHSSNINNVNPMFAQNFNNNFNAAGNKGRFNGLSGNLPSNNNSNTSGTMFKKNNPNNFQLNLQCDEVLSKKVTLIQHDFMCNQSLVPMSKHPSNSSATTPKHVDKAQTERFQIKRQQRKQSQGINYNRQIGHMNSGRNQSQALIDLQCNQQLFYKQKDKQNVTTNKIELDQIRKRMETILESYQRVIIQKNDTIMKLQAQNQMLKLRNYGK